MVTVVMAVYGEREERLFREITNVFHQKEVDVHLVVSTVQGDPCIKWLERYPLNVQVLVNPLNEHPGRSPLGSFYQLSEGVKLIKGEWFCWMGANDITKTDKFISEIRECEKTGKKVCSSDIKIGDKIKRIPKYDYEEHLKRNFIPDRSLVSSDLLRKYLPFSKLYNCGFWDLWLRIYEGEGDVFCRTEKVGWTYLQHPESMHIKRRENVKDMKLFEQARKEMIALHLK